MSLLRILRQFVVAVVCTLAIVYFATASLAATTIHVVTNGDDSADGSAEHPFKSLHQAQRRAREVRANRRDEAIAINIGAGDYVLAETLNLTPEDSAPSADHSLTFKSSGEARISGGTRIDGIQGGDGHWVAKVPESIPPFRDLWVNGRRAIRARSPNEGYFRIASSGPDRRTSFVVEPKDLLAIAHPKTAEVVYFHDWSISRIGMDSIDSATRSYHLAAPIGANQAFFAICGFERHPRYFVENTIELLDAPGEWFLDSANHELHYMPREGEAIDKVEVIASRLQQLVVLRGTDKAAVENVRFEGLAFSNSAYDLPPFGFAEIQANCHSRRQQPADHAGTLLTAAVTVDLAKNCSFKDCRFEHLAGAGLHMVHSSDIRVEHSTFSDIGGNGIMVGSLSSIEKPAAVDNVIENCTMERCGQTLIGGVGIWIGMAANTVVRNNEMHDLPYSGISIGWCWDASPTICRGHQIRNNNIHHVMQQLSDGGGIYTLGWQPGTVLAGNVIHDIPVNAGRAESNGIFIDQGSTDLQIEGNTIYGLPRSPIRFNMSGKNTVSRNRLAHVPDAPTFQYTDTKPDDMTFVDNKVIEDAAWQPPAGDSAVKQAGPQAGSNKSP